MGKWHLYIYNQPLLREIFKESPAPIISSRKRKFLKDILVKGWSRRSRAGLSALLSLRAKKSTVMNFMVSM